MNRGIYIVGNDRVCENAIALLNSIRLYDEQVPIYLIPFDDHSQKIAAVLGEQHAVQLFPNLELVQEVTNQVSQIFDRGFLALPNKMRKLLTWLGPLDEFLYIDTDIIVFEKIADTLNYLSDYDFLCCDYHHRGRGLQDIFSPLVREQKIFTESQLTDVFNSGFWASKKGIFSQNQIYDLLKECAQHREYFDFSRQTTDQPILNYLVLKSIEKRLNLVRTPEGTPGSWAGSTHFEERDRILYDHGKRLKYLHWAGTPMRPGGPYRELWEHYRYLYEPKPSVRSQPTPGKNFPQQIIEKIKKKLF